MKAAHSTGHSGGLAVIHSHDLELFPNYLPTTSSYECLAFQCKLPFPMTVLSYHPPKLIPTFMTEMYDFFTKLCTTSTNTIILRDINIHVVTLPTATVLTIDLLTSLGSIVYLTVFQHTVKFNGDMLNMMVRERQEKTALHFSAGVSNFSVTVV